MYIYSKLRILKNQFPLKCKRHGKKSLLTAENRLQLITNHSKNEDYSVDVLSPLSTLRLQRPWWMASSRTRQNTREQYHASKRCNLARQLSWKDKMDIVQNMSYQYNATCLVFTWTASNDLANVYEHNLQATTVPSCSNFSFRLSPYCSIHFLLGLYSWLCQNWTEHFEHLLPCKTTLYITNLKNTKKQPPVLDFFWLDGWAMTRSWIGWFWVCTKSCCDEWTFSS